MKLELSLVHVIYYIKGPGVCLGVPVADKLVDVSFYGHNYDLKFPVIPGTSYDLNTIPIQCKWGKSCSFDLPQSDSVCLSVLSIILCTSYPYFYVIGSRSWDKNWARQLKHSLPIFSLSPSLHLFFSFYNLFSADYFWF